ncbi:alpha-amylase family glycosyl hydrolase [Salinimicrobium sp. TH3]|uniref:alpha-amylase family glycosyl hydrolase n=1 Tax=Salinimicrobium sp. TH3 TaxID=2997342 RepID=UPI002273D6E0|nr:alpha-amylase family glycosyl hydrolase [Salinimicrobium sp. TH3]MCY2687121.1 alpha-amylase family glycosyl hydrolase [Salinimicrobium sp. TH3]
MNYKEYLWWHKGVVYQIYPRSFKDSDGDGVGDLRGIIEKLDYLKDLGVDAVWISPIYPSPMADFGYDVSDYTGIHPLFGEMKDFDELLTEVHQRGMKLILDLVPNHSSNKHPWFLESKSSKNNHKRDWYIWKDPGKDGGPPNNWLSVFGGSGWEYDEKTEQYYYHAFLKEQPDLNWRNPDLQQAMLAIMRYWLKKGVDGFRVDVMWHMIKDEQLRDDPPNPEYKKGMNSYSKLLPAYSTDQDEVHDIVHKMRKVIDEYDERLLIGEIYLPISKLVSYYGEDNQGAHLPFNFQLLQLPWNAARIKATIDEYEGALPENGWPNWVLGNHDNSRIASRVGKDQAKNAAILLLTLRGTPTIYYGDELGMQDVDIPKEKIQDPQALNEPGVGRSRDPERTPMQWDATKNAGFTKGDPWLPLMVNYKEINVKKQWDQPGSMLQLHRKLLKIRAQEPALHVGNYLPVLSQDGILSYIRKYEEQQFLIVLNLTDSEVNFAPGFKWTGTVKVSSHEEFEGKEMNDKINLPANLGLVIKLE